MVPVIDKDIEFSGQLNQTLAEGKGSEFNLMLSMLMEDWFHRPRIEASPSQHQPDHSVTGLARSPVIPLKAETTHWRDEELTGALVREQQLISARLWSAMHPCPLSLHNDPEHIDDEILANLSYQARQRATGQTPDNQVALDATGLYDILQSMRDSAAEAQAA